MSIIRRHQGAITGVFPHNGNRRFVIGRQKSRKSTATMEGPPVNLLAPRISPAEAEVGTELTCGTGLWYGERPITYAFAWWRDALPLGITTQAYTVQEADRGAALSCVVTATNAAGSDSKRSLYVQIPATGDPVAADGAGLPDPMQNAMSAYMNVRFLAEPVLVTFNFTSSGDTSRAAVLAQFATQAQANARIAAAVSDATTVTLTPATGETITSATIGLGGLVVFGPFVDAASRTTFWIRGSSLADAEIGFSIDADPAEPELWIEPLAELKPEGLSKAAWRRMADKLRELLQ